METGATAGAAPRPAAGAAFGADAAACAAPTPPRLTPDPSTGAPEITSGPPRPPPRPAGLAVRPGTACHSPVIDATASENCSAVNRRTSGPRNVYCFSGSPLRGTAGSWYVRDWRIAP